MEPGRPPRDAAVAAAARGRADLDLTLERVVGVGGDLLRRSTDQIRGRSDDLLKSILEQRR